MRNAPHTSGCEFSYRLEFGNIGLLDFEHIPAMFLLRCLRLSAVVMIMVASQESLGAKLDPLKLWYDSPATAWVEALPIGNGRLGAMVFGDPARDTVQLNEDTVWAGGPYRNDNPLALEALPRIPHHNHGANKFPWTSVPPRWPVTATITAVRMMSDVVHHLAFSLANIQWATAVPIAEMAVAVPKY
jgi:hypothetical protein